MHYTQNGKLGDENLRSALSSLFTKLRVFPTPSFPFCTIPKMENSELETSEFSLRFTRTAIFFNYLNSEFSILHYTQNRKLRDGKPQSLIRRRWRKPEVFISEFSILSIVQNVKVGVGKPRSLTKVPQSLMKLPQSKTPSFPFWV